MTLAACISSIRVTIVGAPARCATSASPVASMTTFESRRDKQAVEHRHDARLLHEAVGHQLEALAVELIGERLALRYRGAHRLGAFLELPPDASGLDCRLMAVPGEPLDPDSRDVAAEASEAFDEAHLRSRPRRRECCSKPARAGTDHQDLGATDDLDLSSRLGEVRSAQCFTQAHVTRFHSRRRPTPGLHGLWTPLVPPSVPNPLGARRADPAGAEKKGGGCDTALGANGAATR